MRPHDFDIHRVIDSIAGTCDDLDTHIGHLYEIDDFDFTRDCSGDELATLDGEIFQCDQCGWWCDAGDMIEDESICSDCRPQDD